MPRLARKIAALPGSTATVEDVRLKLEATSGRILFPKGLTAATREAGGEPLVTGRARPFDEGTLRRSLKTMATLGATRVLERAVEKQVEGAAGTTTGRTAVAHTDMVDQPYFTKAFALAGPIGSLNNKMLAGVYFGVTTIRVGGGAVLVYHLSWHKPATPLLDALKDLHASPSRHAWLTAHLRRHTWDRGGNGRPTLRWAYAQEIPYLTVSNGWVYLSSQRAPMGHLLSHQPVFVRRDVSIERATSTPVAQSPRVVIFPAHPTKGTFGARGLRYRTNGALEGDEAMRMDEVYKARWPEGENVFKALKGVGFCVNRDRVLVLATSRGTDGAIQRLEARDQACQGKIEVLRKQPPTTRVLASIEREKRKQKELRGQSKTLKAKPLLKKTRPSTGLELLCKYLLTLLTNALALVLALSPIAAVRALTPALVRALLWGRSATAEVTPRCVTLWIDPVVGARQRLLQVELLRLFNNEAPLRLHGARIRLCLSQPGGIDSS